MKKLHNPKSHAPAVYIPCWLIQIPNSILSYAAKILYGRLAQWSNESGDVFRSYNQLAQEIGSSKRSINEYLRELRECNLIGTLQPQAGGLNHFVFYDHPWMHEKINQFLCYKSEIDPEQDSALPRAGFCSTPEQDSASINKKEIKEIKDPPNPVSKKTETVSIQEKEYFETWNELAEIQGFKRISFTNQDHMKKCKRQLKNFLSYWPELNSDRDCKISADNNMNTEYFKQILSAGIEAKSFILQKERDPYRTFDIVLRQSNFEKMLHEINLRLR